MRNPNLSGFTLFYHPGKGWQMSVRREGEPGWCVSPNIPEEQAQSIFSLLETSGHPDGPWTVRAPIVGQAGQLGLVEEIAWLSVAIQNLTEAIDGMA